MKFLLCVGAEKSGTTWLHHYFKNHPEYHDIGKELNVIQRDSLVPTFVNNASHKNDIEKYFGDISKLNSVTGDFTHYEGSTENVYRLLKNGLKKYDIDVVPVYIMREPISRAWSSYNMIGGKASDSFQLDFPAHFLLNNFLACKYKETILALDSVFSKPLYFFYEDFFRQDNIDIICDELEIGRYKAKFDLKINEGKYSSEIPSEFIETYGLCKKNSEAISFVKERFENVPWNHTYTEHINR
jgi:hypothetical protein